MRAEHDKYSIEGTKWRQLLRSSANCTLKLICSSKRTFITCIQCTCHLFVCAPCPSQVGLSGCSLNSLPAVQCIGLEYDCMLKAIGRRRGWVRGMWAWGPPTTCCSGNCSCCHWFYRHIFGLDDDIRICSVSSSRPCACGGASVCVCVSLCVLTAVPACV